MTNAPAGKPVCRWKVSVEWEIDDEGAGMETTTVTQTGAWFRDQGKRAAIECLVLDFAQIAKMLAESGRAIGCPTSKELCEAWDDSFS